MATGLSVTPRGYRRVVMGAGVMLAVIIVSGAAVRLTASGLGCSDWPNCTEDSLTPEWSFHGWVEFGNRIFTGVVSAAVILAVLAAHFRRPRNPRLILLAAGLVAGVLAQILVGAAVVLLELSPISVTAHFLISMVLLANAVALFLAADPEVSASANPASKESLSKRLRIGHLALGALVLVSGTVVTGTGPNSGDARAERLPFDLETVAKLHSATVWVFLILTVGVSIKLGAQSDSRESMQIAKPITATRFLLLAILTQGAIGYWQYTTGVPPILVQLHVVGSIAVWGTTVWLFLVSAPRALSEPSTDATLDVLIDVNA